MSGVADQPQRWSRSESCVARAGLSTARRARVEGLWRSALGEAADVVGACRPVGAPDSGYVLSATLLSGPSPIRAALSRRVPLRRRRDGSPSSARGASGPTPLRPIAGSHEGNRRTEIRRADRTVCGWPRRPAKQGLVAISGSTERSTDGGHYPCGQGSRLSRRVLPPPLFFECGSYPRRKGAVRCKAGELQVRARPRVGWARPASGCFSHGHTPSRPAAIAQRTYVPTSRRRETGGRQLVEPCAPLFTVAPLDLTYPRRCSESRQVERPRTRQWSSRGSAGAPVRTVLPAELDGRAGSMRPLVMVPLARSISGPACGGQSPERSAFLVDARVRFVAAICPRRSGRGVRRADRCPQPSR